MTIVQVKMGVVSTYVGSSACRVDADGKASVASQKLAETKMGCPHSSAWFEGFAACIAEARQGRIRVEISS